MKAPLKKDWSAIVDLEQRYATSTASRDAMTAARKVHAVDRKAMQDQATKLGFESVAHARWFWTAATDETGNDRRVDGPVYAAACGVTKQAVNASVKSYRATLQKRTPSESGTATDDTDTGSTLTGAATITGTEEGRLTDVEAITVAVGHLATDASALSVNDVDALDRAAKELRKLVTAAKRSHLTAA